MTCLFIYRMTSDTGFAPCAENGLLSLACCKGGQIRGEKTINTGLRYRIGAKKNSIDYAKDDVYIMGTYKNKMLYLAKVTSVVTMEQYYSGMSKGRTDDIFSLKDGKIIRNDWLKEYDVHTDPGRVLRDLAGKYVILSDDYIYLGEDAVYIESVVKNNAKFQETKLYVDETAKKIISDCENYRDNNTHIPNEPYIKHGGCK
ncbi:hypothetical protein [Butyrivibrio fibrisolvens]|uniref:Nmad2 family putative nucleotide modification protein n=1 Tax=Butyrivibrio fibrisolvens TaxID=831 RepID=UPI00042729A6|nr:hypothetical protein [Butyrivibrio fibrisolvens]